MSRRFNWLLSRRLAADTSKENFTRDELIEAILRFVSVFGDIS